jgi:hypothetical protein
MLRSRPGHVPVGQLLRYQDPWRQSLAIAVEGILLILPHDNEKDGFLHKKVFSALLKLWGFLKNIGPDVVSAGKLAPSVLCGSHQHQETRGRGISAVKTSDMTTIT